MTSKYIDLTDRIEEGAEYSNTTSFRLGIECALRWLDDHPDQAPGRTITESELRKVAGRLFARWPDLGVFMGHLQRELSELGITHVPDPKPTNADILADFVRQLSRTVMSAEECGKWLDERGVKALGGDDD